MAHGPAGKVKDRLGVPPVLDELFCGKTPCRSLDAGRAYGFPKSPRDNLGDRAKV